MKLSEIRYALAVLAREIPDGFCEQTAEWACVSLISRVRAAYRRRAAEIVRDAAGESMYRELARMDRRAADRRAADAAERSAAAAARRLYFAAADALEMDAAADAADAAAERAERMERAAGMRLAFARPAPGELAPVEIVRAAAAAAERAAAAAAERVEAGRRAERFRRAAADAAAAERFARSRVG